MDNKRKIIFIFEYLVIFYLILTIIFLFFRSKNILTNQVKLQDSLLYNYRVIGSDVCSRSIYGEPLMTTTDFVKVNFYCDNNQRSTNTIALDVLSNRKVGAAIDEVLRILQQKMPVNFKCFYEGKAVVNNEETVLPGKRIDCLAPQLDIQNVYPSDGL